MFFIIFTIGRTGSTLLVNILNKYTGVTCAGEVYNLNLFSKLDNNGSIGIGTFEIFGNKKYVINGNVPYSPLYLPKNTNYHKYFRKPIEFYDEFIKIKNMEEKLKFIMPQNENSGCKILGNEDKLKYFLTFKNLRPYFKIILLIRENVNELKDSWKRARFNHNNINFKEQNEAYIKIAKENPSDTYLLSYEDIVNNTNRFKNMFSFLGLEYNKKRNNIGLGTVCSFASSLI